MGGYAHSRPLGRYSRVGVYGVPMSDDEPTGVRDRMDVVVTAETAAEAYPSPPENRQRDQRQPISWDALEALPEAFTDPIRQAAERSRVWVYMLPDARVGVEVLNAPLRKHHKALSVPAENRA